MKPPSSPDSSVLKDFPVKKLGFDNLENSPESENEKSIVEKIFNDSSSNFKSKHLVITKPKPPAELKTQLKPKKILDRSQINEKKRNLIADFLKAQEDYDKAFESLIGNYETILKCDDQQTEKKVPEKQLSEVPIAYNPKASELFKLPEKSPDKKNMKKDLQVILERKDSESDFTPVVHSQLGLESKKKNNGENKFNPLPLGTKPFALSTLETRIGEMDKIPEQNNLFSVPKSVSEKNTLPPHMVLPVYKSNSGFLNSNSFNPTIHPVDNAGNQGYNSARQDFGALKHENNPKSFNKTHEQTLISKFNPSVQSSPFAVSIHNPFNPTELGPNPFSNSNTYEIQKKTVNNEVNNLTPRKNIETNKFNSLNPSTENIFVNKIDQNTSNSDYRNQFSSSNPNIFATTATGAFFDTVSNSNPNNFSRNTVNPFSGPINITSANSIPNPTTNPFSSSMAAGNNFINTNTSQFPGPAVNNFANPGGNSFFVQTSNSSSINPNLALKTLNASTPNTTNPPNNAFSSFNNTIPSRNPYSQPNLNPFNSVDPGLKSLSPFGSSGQYKNTSDSNPFASKLGNAGIQTNLITPAFTSASQSINPLYRMTSDPIPSSTSQEISLQDYQNIRKTLETPEYSIKPQLEDLMRACNSILTNMGSHESTKVSSSLIEVLSKATRHTNFLKVFFTYNLIENYLDSNEDHQISLLLSQSISQVIGSTGIKGLVDFVKYEIWTRNDVFVPVSYTNDQATGSLQLLDLQKFFQGGELQRRVFIELNRSKKLGILLGSLISASLDDVWNIFKNFMALEVTRSWIPSVLGLMVSTYKLLSRSNLNEFQIISQQTLAKLNKVQEKCNVLIFQPFITQIQKLVSSIN